MPEPKTTTKTVAAFALLEEMRELLNDIAASATILGATPFAGAPHARELSAALHGALLEFELGLAELGRHEFQVRA